MRLKCVNDHWKNDLKDPDLTKGRFYDSLDDNVLVIGQEALVSLVGDNKMEIERPKYIFYTMNEVQRKNNLALAIQEKIARGKKCLP